MNAQTDDSELVLTTETRDQWDREFFEDFLLMERHLHKNNLNHLFKSLGDYRKKFRPEAPFNQSNHWCACIVYDQKHQPLSGAIVSAQKTKAKFISIGHLQLANNQKAFSQILVVAKSFALENKVSELRTPIDGTFFDQYRIKSKGSDDVPLFFNEPHHPDYYHDLFSSEDFEIAHRWQTLKFTTEDLRKKFSETNNQKLRVRNLRKAQWLNELNVIHRLLHQSFSKMPDFVPLSFKEFLVLYEPIKLLVDPKLIWFVSNEVTEQGFLVSIMDPYKELINFQNKTKWYYRLPVMGQILLLRRLKRIDPDKRLVVYYLGKNPECKEKGITAKIGELVIRTTAHARCKEMLIAYVSEDSPVRKTLPEKYEVIRDYVLYKLNL